MNKIQQMTAIGLISATLGLGAFVVEKVSSQSQIKNLENQVETIQLEKNIVRSENYQLHLDLIQRGNPQGWELYGDALGNWGYRKPDENAIFGTVGDGYIYLTK